MMFLWVRAQKWPPLNKNIKRYWWWSSFSLSSVWSEETHESLISQLPCHSFSFCPTRYYIDDVILCRWRNKWESKSYSPFKCYISLSLSLKSTFKIVVATTKRRLIKKLSSKTTMSEIGKTLLDSGWLAARSTEVNEDGKQLTTTNPASLGSQSKWMEAAVPGT